MSNTARSLDLESSRQILDDIIDEITANIQTGKPIDLSVYIKKHPSLEASLRSMLPAMEMLATLGASTSEISSHLARDPATGVLGDYRIIREIGRGGMGVVYEAEQISLRRRVALKVLPFAAVLDPRQIQRFQNEALAAAQLKHPHIVSVYGVGCERSVHFYAMEYVEGQTLADVIHGVGEAVPGSAHIPEAESATTDIPEEVCGKHSVNGNNSHDIPAHARDTLRTPQAAMSTERTTKSVNYARQVAELGIQVGEALDHAHQEGILHRDIKPSNLILDSQGKVWVTDFGLARVQADPGMTMTGDIVGTLRYMSPEQALAKRGLVDQRADIYSLCATLYEMLTLEPVFKAHDRQELLRQIAFEEPRSVRSRNPSVPPELETIILKGIDKSPEQRYDSAQQLADDLQRFLDGKPIHAKPPTLLQRVAKWSGRNKPIVASTAITLVLLTIGLAISNVVVTSERNKKELALGELARALGDKQDALEAASVNLLTAQSQQSRAEENLRIALRVMDVVLDSIGKERLLRELPDEFNGGPGALAPKPVFNAQELKLLQRGLEFYDQIANSNPASLEARFESGKAFARVALLRAGLDENKEAQIAYEEAIKRLRRVAEQGPPRAEYFLELGRAYYEHGRLSRWWAEASPTFGEAEAELGNAISLNPKGIDAYQLRGETRKALRKWEQALSDYETVVQLDPGSVEGHYSLGNVLVHKPGSQDADKTRALSHLRKAVQLEPENFGRRATFATRLRMALDKEESAAVLQAGLKYVTKPAHEHEIRSWISELQLNHEETVEHVTKFFELNGDPLTRLDVVGLYMRRSTAFHQLGRAEKAIADVKAAEQVALTPWEEHQIAEKYHELGESATALEVLDKAQKHNPQMRTFYRLRAEILLSQAKYDEVILVCNRALELVPRSLPIRGRRAVAHFRKGEYENALADVVAIVKIDPENISSWDHWIRFDEAVQCEDDTYRRGIIELATDRIRTGSRTAYLARGHLRYKLKQYNQALKDLSDFLELATGDTQERYRRLAAHYLRGQVQMDRGEYDEAVRSYTEVINTDSQATAALLNRGWCLSQLGRAEEAVPDWKQVVRYDPRNANGCTARAHGNLSVYFRKLGDWANAIAHWEEIVRLLPEDPGVNQSMALLLISCPDDTQRNPMRSVEFASAAVQLAPQNSVCWETLGLTYYRAGNWQAAIDALNKVEELDTDEFSDSLFVLAMAYYQLGEIENAHHWYKRAVDWMNDNLDDEGIQKLHTEAEELINVPSAPRASPGV